MNFKEIDKHIIPLEEFVLSWRFTDKKYDELPVSHIKELKPFNKDASQFIDKLIKEKNIHNQFPFNNDTHILIDKVEIIDGNDKEIQHWLSQRNLSSEDQVYLSWDSETSLKTKWKYVVEYWDTFYYSVSDDLTIFDESMDWMLLFFHENEIYWGTSKAI